MYVCMYVDTGMCSGAQIIGKIRSWYQISSLIWCTLFTDKFVSLLSVIFVCFCFSFCFVFDLIKYLNKHNLRDQEFILAHSSRVQKLEATSEGYTHSGEREEKEECLLPSSPFSLYLQSRIPLLSRWPWIQQRWIFSP